MSERIRIDPVTRIEGHLKIETRMNGRRVADALTGSQMFRGLEGALVGYDPRAAQHVTQRVCGVCPYAHAEAAAKALEAAMQIEPPPGGRALRNLIVGAYQLHDFLLHFYMLSALDFVDVTAVTGYRGKDRALLDLKAWVREELNSGKVFPAAPFLPRYAAAYAKDDDLNVSVIKSYLDALALLPRAHRLVAIFGGKAPHPVTIEAGGVTMTPSWQDVSHYRGLLDELSRFVEGPYRRDVIAVCQAFRGYFREGKWQPNLLSFPALEPARGGRPLFAGGASFAGELAPLDTSKIYEDHRHAFYEDRGGSAAPLAEPALVPIDFRRADPTRGTAEGKYSWTRAPRYAGQPMEVGPAARVVNTYRAGTNPRLNARVDALNRQLGIRLEDYPSVMGRHLARYVSAATLVDFLREELEAVEPGKSAFEEHPMPKDARGEGLTEATRGALGHWIATDEHGLISRYEMVVPTTWNLSPRDDAGVPGPTEQMLLGTEVADADNPIELARIVRSVDPCMACSVH